MIAYLKVTTLVVVIVVLLVLVVAVVIVAGTVSVAKGNGKATRSSEKN
jgi:flagellar basal body-associated protein FliL